MVFQRAAKRRKAVAYALTSSFLCQLISDFCMYILNQVTGTSMADINSKTSGTQTSTKTHLSQSIIPLRYEVLLHPSLIRSYLSLIKAMRTPCHRWVSDTEDDGGGLQRDFISRCWISFVRSGPVPKSASPEVSP